MAELLTGQLDLLDRQMDSFAADHFEALRCLDLEDAMSMCVSLKDALDRHAERVCGEGANWKEDEARKMVPRYARWLEVAAKVRPFIGQFKAKGFEVAGVSDFLGAIIRARYVVDFDANLDQSRALDRGELKTRPIGEVLDELQRRDDAGR